MGLIVCKFGGTSVGTLEKMRNVAERIIEMRNEGNEVVMVISAMGKMTDELLALAQGAIRVLSGEEEAKVY